MENPPAGFLVCMTPISISITNKSFHFPSLCLHSNLHSSHVWNMTWQNVLLLTDDSPRELSEARLHRWSIATVSVLVLFSFLFTWSRVTIENLNLHILQDLSLLSNNSPGSPQWCLCHICNSQAWAAPLPAAQKRSGISNVLKWQGPPSCLAWSWYSNHHIKMDHNSSSTPKLSRDDESSNCTTCHYEWVRFSQSSASQ